MKKYLQIITRICIFVLSYLLMADHLVPAQLGELEPDDLTPVIRPVIFESHQDGLLLGFDFRVPIVNFELAIGLAYGLGSGAVRIRPQFDYNRIVALDYGGWPGSPVLGRQGETGYHLSLDLLRLYREVESVPDNELVAKILAGSRFRGTLFLGELWPGAGEGAGPNVRYAHLNALIHWPVVSDLVVDTTGNFLFGQSTDDPTRIFQTFSSSTKLTFDSLTFEVRAGEVENPAGLGGLELDLDLRSYPTDFVAGNRFILGSFERSFGFISQHLLVVDLSSILGAELGWIPVRLRADISLFMEGGVILNEQEEQRIDQILFGWGTSLLFPDLQMRIDVAINQEGQPRLTIETGLLP